MTITWEQIEASIAHKNELVGNMARRAGLEHPFTIRLASLAERDHTWDDDFDLAYNSLMAYLDRLAKNS